MPPNILKWIEKNSDGVFILANSAGKLLYIAQSIENLTGYKASDLIGTYWYEWLTDKDVEYVRKQIQETPEASKNVNVNVLNKDGRTVLLECKLDQYRHELGGTFYFLVYLNDITYKKETEEMMIRSEKMSIAGQLAAGIAHEIRNPLTSLKGFLQLLQAGISHKEEYFHVMIDEINKIEAITSELLFISKPLAENRKRETIQAMIDEVFILLQAQAKMKNIELVVIQPIQGEIVCDRSQIKQVLINLVKNAIEAMDEGGTVTVSVECKQESVDIFIADEGNGIPTDILHKLGEPFFTTKQSGTGLGILITKQILKSHEATLHIKQNTRKGSIFQLIFPLTEY
ncbi:ATP-binding protein [Oceanobacillus rekensis]|uniref:ATP-binding protein n=1 Tax=Oceanobacillus rekensis TaxID=937927 RepID=UPI001FE5A85A|nr:ATP-binding protein [Oceanobacillus rekensis]